MTEVTDRSARTGAQVTEHSRRLARFKFAMDRVVKIADGEPRLTDEELTQLAAVLLSRIRDKAA